MKNIKWLIQDTSIEINEIYKKSNALKDLGYNFDFIGVSCDTNFITNIEDIIDENVSSYILLSGVKLVNIINEAKTPNDIFDNKSSFDINIEYNKFKKSIFYDKDSFDQEVYSKYKLPLLNDNTFFYKIGESLNIGFDEDMFIKPSRDLKSFGSGIIKKGMTINEYLKNTYFNVNTFNAHESIIISPKKEIFSEYRFFVVNKKVITGSRYMKDNNMSVSETIPDYILNTVKEFVNLYQPHEIFNIDIAETKDGIKIIEYNCINIAGSYASDLKALYLEINNFLEGK